jgi:hypothetical protein
MHPQTAHPSANCPGTYNNYLPSTIQKLMTLLTDVFNSFNIEKTLCRG